MSNRILLGQKGSEYGLWISKPGIDVTNANVEDLLFSSSFGTRYGQFLAKGFHTFTSALEDTFSVEVTMKNNVAPLVIWAIKRTNDSTVFYPAVEGLAIEPEYAFPTPNTCVVTWTKRSTGTPSLIYFISSLEDS